MARGRKAFMSCACCVDQLRPNGSHRFNARVFRLAALDLLQRRERDTRLLGERGQVCSAESRKSLTNLLRRWDVGFHGADRTAPGMSTSTVSGTSIGTVARMSSNATITPLWVKLRSLLKTEGVNIDSLSVDRLAAALQCSRGTAQRIKEGHTNQRRDTIVHLAKRFDVSEAELLETEEIPSYRDAVVIGVPGQNEASSGGKTKTKQLPGHVIRQYDTGGAMGSGLVLHDQPGLIHSWSVSDDWLRLNVRHYTSASNLCIVTGFGDSMRPVFNPGDPLLVDRGVSKVDFDGMYFFRVGDEGFIKRLQRVPGEGIRVLSANRDNYDPWTIKPDMDFQVLGRVLKVWCGEEF